ncbi:reverse transcriptase domain-containing protein [Tanacetum coccineum]
MKLNPKKCTFGAEEGTFLGHIVTRQGIKACPDKTEAVMKLQSPRILKEAQSLNGKLAKAERAFPNMKKCIAELPMVTAPKPREELIMYLYAAREVHTRVEAVIPDQAHTKTDPVTTGNMVEESVEWKFDLGRFDINIGQPRTSLHPRPSMHSDPRSVVAKSIRSGYYWPTMHKDARNIIRGCNDCQTHRPVPRNPQQKLTPITSPWPFYKWGIDISGPFLEAQGNVKFLIVAIDYITKWIEAKPVATITGSQVKKFVWYNIVCRFGLPGEIISDNGKQFRDNPFKDWCEKLNIRQRERAAVKEARRKARMEKYYNAKVRNTSFRPGDFVYHSNEASRAKESGKLGPKWEGPYEVIEALGKGAYKLRNGSGDILPRTWNVQDLEKCYL